MSILVGLISMRGEPWQLEENYQRLESFVREAAGQGATVVVAPEAVLDGYICGAAADATRERMLEVAQPIPDGPYLKRARALCTELGIYLVFGFLERRGEDLRNSCAMIDPHGEVVGNYSKVFPNGEMFITAGRELRPVDTSLGRVAFLICADRVIGAHWPPYGAQDADIVFLPMDGAGGPDNTRTMQGHAREHGYWILIANTWSRVIVDPAGEVKLEDYTTEGVSVVDVDLAADAPGENGDDKKTLDDLLKKAFGVTANRWGADGRPTPAGIQGEERMREDLTERRERTDELMALPDFGIGNGLVGLSHTSVTDAGLANLERHAETMQGLWLRKTQITDEGLQVLSGFVNLRLLSLRDTKVTDAGMEHVSGLTRLRTLDLSGTRVTDAGLSALGHCTDLRRLYLKDTAVTDEAIGALKQANPNLIVN
jgi:predicted amidohydrolase